MSYTILIEALQCKLRYVVEGLILPALNSAHVLSAYADDLIVMVQTQTDINHLEKTVIWVLFSLLRWTGTKVKHWQEALDQMGFQV